jgi:hypothetical protein
MTTYHVKILITPQAIDNYQESDIVVSLSPHVCLSSSSNYVWHANKRLEPLQLTHFTYYASDRKWIAMKIK